MVLDDFWSKILRAWQALQLTHYGGKYFIERTLALSEFARTTSLIRVALLILTPPLITISIVICQESIPLQDPTTGWKANYGFWPRVWIIGFVLGSVKADLVGPWLDVPALSSRQKLVYCVCVSTALLVVGMATSELWVFPVPFFLLSLLISMSWLFLLLLCAVVGTRAFRRILSKRDELRQLYYVSNLLGIMILGYPAFQILFNKVNHTVYEVPVLLLLPIFKIITKRLFALAALKKWDMVPEQVIFTVDFFDALYLVTCMPSLSAVSFGIILAVDIAQTAIDLFELFHRTQHIPARLHRAARIRDNVDSFSLLAFARLICFNSKILQNQEIQVRSCIPHQLSHQERTVLAQLERCSAACPPTNLVHHSLNRISTSPQRLVAIPDHGRSAVAVHPHPTVSVAPKKTQGDDLVNGDKESSELNSWIVDGSDALQEALEVLFTAECLILTEYLEIVVPVLYGTFLFAMTHLPGAQYHTEMASVTRENVANTVSSVLIYAALELLSFIALAFVMKRNCGIDAYYQLAFVLRTQMPFVLSKLILWMMFTLTFRVTHFGTFR